LILVKMSQKNDTKQGDFFRYFLVDEWKFKECRVAWT
jgi:hypothetical protein